MFRGRKPLSAFVLVLLIVLLSAPLVPGAQTSSMYAVAGTALLFAGDTGVTFEVRVPWEQVRVEPVREGAKAYVRVSLPGWSMTCQAGAPELPFRAETIGAPFGARVRVEVEPGPAPWPGCPAMASCASSG